MVYGCHGILLTHFFFKKILIDRYARRLLPKFKRKVNKELEEKNRMLRENPALLQLYKDLVRVISSRVKAVEIFTEDL